MATTLKKSKVVSEALNVLSIEQSVLNDLIKSIENTQSEQIEKAVNLMLNCKGRIVVTGIGKSGHIGNKIAATLASTGAPAFFVHPAELIHGDFGMIKDSDVMLALSFSGETEELKKILIPVKRRGIKLISISGNENSTLAQSSEVPLFIEVKKEACPLNLAPTASTTATLALGDALAIALMQTKDFTAEDFAKSHPGGSLGKKLVRIKDVMRHADKLPKIKNNSNYNDILDEITNKKLGFTTVVNSEDQLVGVISDGDLRRAMLKYKQEIFTKNASEIMSKEPKTIEESDLAVTALKIMEDHKISDIVIKSKQGCPIGIVHLKDLLKAGIV